MAASHVGMIGLGIMGSAMAAGLMRAGFEVDGYDVLPAAARRLERGGGAAHSSVVGVARAARCLITSLPSGRSLLLACSAIARAGRRNLVVVETSTLPLDVKERARRILARAGIALLDCPLSGTGAQAKTGDLAVYASGSAAAYRRILPVLEAFSRAQYYLGAFGNGSKMKFAANLLVAIHNASAAEAIVLARRAGLSARKAVAILGDGAGASRMLQVRGPMMARRRYTPATMKNEVWQKDMKIIAAFARALRSPTPLFDASKPVYREALRRGFAKADTAAVAAVLERRALRPPARR